MRSEAEACDRCNACLVQSPGDGHREAANTPDGALRRGRQAGTSSRCCSHRGMRYSVPSEQTLLCRLLGAIRHTYGEVLDTATLVIGDGTAIVIELEGLSGELVVHLGIEDIPLVLTPLLEALLELIGRDVLALLRVSLIIGILQGTT